MVHTTPLNGRTTYASALPTGCNMFASIGDPVKALSWALLSNNMSMKVKTILPIDALHGKLDGRSEYYFRSIHGKQFAQRCPVKKRADTDAEKAKQSLFGKRAKMVSKMMMEGVHGSRKELWALVMSEGINE